MITLRRILLGVFILTLVSSQLVSTVSAISAVKEFDSPGEFPTGLTWDGEYLWVSDFMSEMIYKVDPDDGSVIESFSSPDSDPEGLAWDGNYLWHVDGGNAYTLGEDAEIYIYKIDPQSGDATQMFEAPGGLNAEDLAWGGGYLWYVDGAPEAEAEGTKTIYKIDVSNGEVVKEFSAPGNHPSGLTWIGSYLWHSDYYNEKIYIINPDNGNVIDSFSAPSEYPGGLAWDGSYLWCADWNSAKIYSMDVSSFLEPEDTTPPNIIDVSQTPLENNVLPEDEVKVNVTVTDDLSGVKQVTLNYTNGNGTWITVDMTNLEGDVWNATIPAFPYCTNVTYIIIAEDNANNTTEDMGYEYQYHVIPEFPSFIIMPLFMIATLLAVTVYKRKHST